MPFFKVMFIGDIFGRPGRKIVKEFIPRLVNEYELDLVIANAENASGGNGLTPDGAEEILNSGVDLLTSGNHIFRYPEISEYLDNSDKLIRPANYPDPCPGQGSTLLRTPGGVKVGLVNLMGRVFMDALECPFRTADKEIESLKSRKADIILVDIHAEATSEKQALGRYLEGQVGAVLGTHTHVQTSDECILPKGTAYISDLGMTGPHDSVLGMKKELVLEKFLTGRPIRFTNAKKDVRLEGVILKFEIESGKAHKITRIRENFITANGLK